MAWERALNHWQPMAKAYAKLQLLDLFGSSKIWGGGLDFEKCKFINLTPKEGRGFDSCVIGIFHLHSSSGRTMALRLTQPLTEMRTRNISWGVKMASAYHLLVPYVLKYGSLNLLEPSGTVQACKRISVQLLPNSSLFCS